MTSSSMTKQELLLEISRLKKRIRHLEMSEAQSKDAKEQLQACQKQFRAIADYAPDWENWIGPDGKPIWVNPRVLEFTGYTVEECLNMPDYPMALVDQVDEERIRPLFNEAVGGFCSGGVECRIVCKNGQKKWVDISWQPVRDQNDANLGHRSSIRDIQSRKLTEEQLHNSSERLAAMLSALPDLMFRLDRNGCIHECHASDINRFYLPPSLFIGKNITDVLPKEAAEIIMNALNDAAATGSHHGATYSLSMAEGVTWHELSIARMGKHHQPAQEFIGLVRDITDRKNLEEELKKARTELELRVMERTAELTKAISDFHDQQNLLAIESHRLEESNTALKVLLRHREEDQQDFERKVLNNARKLLFPYLDKLKLTPLTPMQAAYVNVIITNLHNIMSPFLKNLSDWHRDLTPREIEVANLVREGKSAKDISLLLHSSIRSIEFHKDNIRRKLGLKHTKRNLRTYLSSLHHNSSS